MINGLTISVVMATYNGSSYLREQLDSVINQTVIPDELLISDDGSTDETWSILEDYAQQFPFIKLRHNTANHGPSGNFIAAFRVAKGDVLFPCDQDDIWLPAKIEKMMMELIDGVDIVAAQDIVVDEIQGKESFSNWGFPSLNKVMWLNYLAGHSCCFRRKIIQIYEYNHLLSFDYMLCLYGSITHRSITICDKLVRWRRHSSTVTCGDQLIDKEAPSSKYGKLIYAIRQCHNGLSSRSFSDYMHAREIVLQRMGGGKIETAIIRYVKRQNTYGFIMAGICYAHVSNKFFRTRSIRQRIAHTLWAFCYPAVYWTEVRKEQWIT